MKSRNPGFLLMHKLRKRHLPVLFRNIRPSRFPFRLPAQFHRLLKTGGRVVIPRIQTMQN